VAGGLEVQRVGVCPLARREIAAELLGREATGSTTKVVTLDAFREILAELRRKKKKVVYTNGCFDLLHAGHVRLLELARGLGDVLVVGLNSDRALRAWKAIPGRPLVPETERARVLAALSAVDFVILFDDATPIRMIEAILPDILVKGEDYREKVVVGREVVEAAGGRVVLAPLVPGLSTTELIRRAGEAAAAGAGGNGGTVGEERFAVYRQDDHGNEFLVQGGLSREAAEELASGLEGRGHKQTYGVRVAGHGPRVAGHGPRVEG
jgi:D-beta-D-heptose 7-phosphate kinase/D-beta-D-heptose 1-phosphate adenosyltransferase